MTENELTVFVKHLVADATALKDAHTDQKGIGVGYACIFAQSQPEFDELHDAAERLGKVVKTTPTGPVFEIPPLETVAGNLRVLKIRKPDPTRTERGDADFNLPDYETFKQANLQRLGFKHIQRDTFEMIELMEEGANVRVYFSNPPVEKQLGLA